MLETLKAGTDGRLSDADAAKAGAAAKSCRIVALPTETAYVLGSTGLIKAATRRLLQVKERSTLKPLPVLVASSEEAKKWVEWTPLAERLAAKLWPGPVALLLKPTAQGRLLTFPEYPTVAVRVPAHAAARQVIAASGVPWVYTSANKSTRPPLGEPAAVAAELGAEIDVLVDAGPCPATEPTLVDASGDAARVIKVGAVSAETVREAAGA
jgi:L-threonylcarbamoyladenylate synthase